MDAASLVVDLEAAKDTELVRLASPKVLIARTDARLEREPILRAVVGLEANAAAVLADWAADSAGEPSAVFAAVADRHRDCADHVAALLEDDGAAEEPDPIVTHLADLDGTIPRVAAGLVAYPLVLERLLTQVVGYFINQADPQTTDRFRDVKADQQSILSIGRELLDDLCRDEADWAEARTAAEETIAVAYGEYVRSLDALGINPKPVC